MAQQALGWIIGYYTGWTIAALAFVNFWQGAYQVVAAVISLAFLVFNLLAKYEKWKHDRRENIRNAEEDKNRIARIFRRKKHTDENH